MVSVHPARRRTSPLGVVPGGLGNGVGDCHDVTNLPTVCLFISIFSIWGKQLYSFFQGIVLFLFLLLGMLVAKGEPTTCYNDSYSVGHPQRGILGERQAKTM